MFALGMFVGRNSGPVCFETRPFQERIGKMVMALADKRPDEKKMELEFYKDLAEPVYHPIKGRDENSTQTASAAGLPENAYSPENRSEAAVIPMKHSKKLATLNLLPAESKAPKVASGKKSIPPEQKLQRSGITKNTAIKPSSPVGSESLNTDAGGQATQAAQGAYTIQVASYKNFNDAVTQMTILKKKGISSYRVRGELDGTTWYRVRTGSFADYKAAQAGLDALGRNGVKGMVIKKE